MSQRAVELADTIYLPDEALNYIAATPYSATTMETILSFVMRTNLYTLTTGRPLTILSVRELSTAATASGVAGTGRMVVYKNDENFVKLHLPMPHRFLPVYQDGLWSSGNLKCREAVLKFLYERHRFVEAAE